ncbi:MAG: peptidase dimerization domain-containing protein [Kiritimatiellae bacterium]|nr:peptidase dimerization domain-containing protein [Kiritimatiellia bacterium]
MNTIDAILDSLPGLQAAAGALREQLLANLVMIGEIPAPTGHEQARVEFLLQRFAEGGLQHCSTDEIHNGAGLLPGTEGQRTLLLAAYADTAVPDDTEQTIEVETDRVVGPFVVDNCIALAALATLPALLEKAGVRLRSNVLFLAAARSYGRGNLEGLKFFLDHAASPVHAGLCVEGVQLGRLNYACLGMLRGEITCRLPDEYNWAQHGATGSIIPMNDVITRINRIAVPRRPFTSVVLGMIHGGISHQNIARQTTLGLEIRSESAEILQQLRDQIEDIAEELSAQSGVVVTADFFARRAPGGLDRAHPLVRAGHAVLSRLGLAPMTYLTTSGLSAFAARRIPALTLGVTTGERLGRLDEFDEACAIGPMATGLAQLAGLLLAADGDPADEPA